jgi:hypothetical protein
VRRCTPFPSLAGLSSRALISTDDIEVTCGYSLDRT